MIQDHSRSSVPYLICGSLLHDVLIWVLNSVGGGGGGQQVRVRPSVPLSCCSQSTHCDHRKANIALSFQGIVIMIC